MTVTRPGSEPIRQPRVSNDPQRATERPIRTDTGPATRGVTHLVQRATSSARRSHELQHPSASAALRRLDEFRRSFAGPYVVEGKRLLIDPHFRMNGGYGTNPDEAVRRASVVLTPKVLASLSSALRLTATGKAEPRVLVRVTQALIDAGAQREFGEGPEAVRKMMWKYGIGVDCSGYCRRAFLASRGVSEAQASARYGIGRSVDGFDPDQLRSFRKVKCEAARAGDVCKLGHGRDNHKVIVARHDVIPGGQRSVEVPGHGPLPASFRGSGRVHVFEVDSSWGAGPHGSAQGGVGRRVWVYSEATGRWGSYHASTGKLEVSSKGPYGYALNGFFRPRNED